MPLIEADADILRIAREAKTIAVLGAHPSTWRPAFYVPDHMHRVGARVLPVNPRFAGQTLWGETVLERVTDVAEPVDMVNIFRRPELIDAHADEVLAMDPRPRSVWLQLGIRNDEAARRLSEAGIEVVQDRCLMVEQRRA